MKKTIEKYLQARDEVSFKYNKAGAKIWYRAHANIETGVIDTGKANGWSCDHDIKINRFQAALILEKYGLTIEQFITAEKEFYATRYPETNNEANPDDYAVTEDALEVAVNAEIKNANNEAPKFKYYLQSRRPIAGAVPNGYISATQGEMKVHSLRSDGSISPVPKKVVFGVVVYDHPLSDQQIINYDLHVDPLNPKVEPDTTELSNEEIAEIKRRSQINAIKSRIATYERAIERQYDQQLENRLLAAKAQLAEIELANTHEADHIADTGIKEDNVGNHTDSALDASNSRLAAFRTERELQVERKELIADGYKFFLEVKTPQLHPYRKFDFRDCVYPYKSLDAAYSFGINKINDNEWKLQDADGNTIAKGTGATQFNSNQINDVEDKPVDKIISAKDDDFQVKLATLQDEYDATIIENEKAIDAVKSAEKALQAARELEQIAAGKRIATGNAIYNFGSAKAAELRNKCLPVETFNRSQMFITNQFDCKRGVYLETIYIEFYNYKFSIIADNEYGTFTLGEYDTPAQVEKVIGMFKAAITSGDKDFTFPTVDELTALPVSRNNLKIEKEARRKTG